MDCRLAACVQSHPIVFRVFTDRLHVVRFCSGISADFGET
jgi:hypothetical protein